MGVDHRGGDILVSQQFLDGADVVAILQQVGGEGVPQGMAGCAFADVGSQHGLGHRLLHHRLVQVVALELPIHGIAGRLEAGEDILPRPVLERRTILPGESQGCRGHADPGLHIAFVPFTYHRQMTAQRIDEDLGQWRAAADLSFAIDDQQHAVVEVDVLDAQAQGLQDTEAAAVQQKAGESQGWIADSAQHALHLVPAQHGRNHGWFADCAERRDDDLAEVIDLLQEQDEGAHGLALGGRRHMPGARQVGQKWPNVPTLQFPGLCLRESVERAAASDPGEVAPFAAQAVVADAESFGEDPQGAGFRQFPVRDGFHGVECIRPSQAVIAQQGPVHLRPRGLGNLSEGLQGIDGLHLLPPLCPLAA